MGNWVRILSWALILFCAPGLLIALVQLDWVSAAINGALLAIGVIDLKNVRLMDTDPALAQRRMSWTQLALGVIVGISFVLFGAHIVESNYWEQAREIIGEFLPVSDYEWRAKITQAKAVIKWGTLIGGIVIFLGQVWIFIRLRKTAQGASLSKD